MLLFLLPNGNVYFISDICRKIMHKQTNTLKSRQQFLRDAENAWLEYEATGLHLTGNELSDWLDAIARDEDKELPECHL